MNLLLKTQINQPLKMVAKKFNRDLFEFLTPAWAAAKLRRFDGCKQGDEVHLALSVAGIKQDWISVITSNVDTENEWSFVDEGKILPWPIKKWHHHHKVIRISEYRVEIIDDIHYECANEALEKMIYPVMWATFSIRPGRYRKFFRN